MNDTDLIQRVEGRIREWDVTAQGALETQSSVIVFGRRADQAVVLKVLRHPSDEWRCGEVLNAFDGAGVVRVYEYTEGAVLLERLDPGTPLAGLAIQGRDQEATDIIADAIHRMSHRCGPLKKFATVRDWGRGFDRYLAGADGRLSRELVEEGRQWYMKLCASQREARLLHGDLHHYNILYDSGRGWTAIDPKGVVGELEYEVGASLRNPYEKPGLLAKRATIERRLRQYEDKLKLDSARALRWGFAQAVLSAIWSVEDGFPVDETNPSVMLARAIRPML